MKKRLSIIELSKLLQVSPTTISFILNGKAKEKRISDELVKRVLKQIEEIGYKPNTLAQSFRTGKTMIIGLMVEDIANPFFAGIARLIEEKAYKNGYKILYCSTDNDSKKTRELIGMFQDRHVDGYIISPPENVEAEVQGLLDNGTPVVLFDRYLPGIKADYVVINNEGSTSNAVLHLIQNGFKEIAFVTLDSLQTQMQDRLKGYEDTLTAHGLKHYIKEFSFHQNEENVIRQITSFLQRKSGLQAVILGTNYIGMMFLKAVRQLGLRIPDDLAVIAFDDHTLFELHTPSVTAIAQPIEEISDKLMTILLGRLNKTIKSEKTRTDVLSTKLIIRDSTKKQAKSDDSIVSPRTSKS